MSHFYVAAMALLAGAALVVTACGGGSKSSTPTAVSATARAGSTPSASVAGTTTVSRTASPAANASPSTTTGTPATVASPAPSTKVFGADDAKKVVTDTALLPPDLPSGWKVQMDTTADNAAAAVTEPKASASFERCGRLLGRTVTNLPVDAVSSFLAGETLSFFSSVTVYATEAGAADCQAEAAARYAMPGELARALGSLFINPDAVVVALADAPAEIPGSVAVKLTGQINAAGTTIDLTVLLVSFRRGGVTAVAGSARSGQDPPLPELLPYALKLVQRVAAFTNG